jgi:hypothetical protein
MSFVWGTPFTVWLIAFGCTSSARNSASPHAAEMAPLRQRTHRKKRERNHSLMHDYQILSCRNDALIPL